MKINKLIIICISLVLCISCSYSLICDSYPSCSPVMLNNTHPDRNETILISMYCTAGNGGTYPCDASLDYNLSGVFWVEENDISGSLYDTYYSPFPSSPIHEGWYNFTHTFTNDEGLYHWGFIINDTDSRYKTYGSVMSGLGYDAGTPFDNESFFVGRVPNHTYSSISFDIVNVSGYCYQETANISTSCGGLSTGLYTEIWSGVPIVGSGLWYDGDAGTGTYAGANSTTNGIALLYSNYTVPSLLANATLNIKSGIYGYSDYNISIPQDCLQSTVLELLINQSRSYIGSTKYWDIHCFNGTWKNMTTISSTLGTSFLYEESVYWNINSELNSTNLSFLWNDDVGLSSYTLSTNISGTWSNSSVVFISGLSNWSNVSFNLPTSERYGYYEIYVNDSDSYFNSTGIKSVLVLDHPAYYSLSLNDTTVNKTLNFSAIWSGIDLSYYIFSTNNSGSWVNYSYLFTSNISSYISSYPYPINLYWMFYANNSIDMYNSTGVQMSVINETISPGYVVYNTLNNMSNMSFDIGVYVYDNYNISEVIISENFTGIWVNHSNIQSGAAYFYNLTDNVITNEGNYSWFVYVNDTSGNYNVSGLNNVTIYNSSKLSFYISSLYINQEYSTIGSYPVLLSESNNLLNLTNCHLSLNGVLSGYATLSQSVVNISNGSNETIYLFISGTIPIGEYPSNLTSVCQVNAYGDNHTFVLENITVDIYNVGSSSVHSSGGSSSSSSSSHEGSIPKNYTYVDSENIFKIVPVFSSFIGSDMLISESIKVYGSYSSSLKIDNVGNLFEYAQGTLFENDSYIFIFKIPYKHTPLLISGIINQTNSKDEIKLIHINYVIINFGYSIDFPNNTTLNIKPSNVVTLFFDQDNVTGTVSGIRLWILAAIIASFIPAALAIIKRIKNTIFK